MYWIVSFASGYIEESSPNKCLNFLAENKNLLKKYTEFWDLVKHKIKKINEGKVTDYIKIKFESNDDLPLNEPLIFYEMHMCQICF